MAGSGQSRDGNLRNGSSTTAMGLAAVDATLGRLQAAGAAHTAADLNNPFTATTFVYTPADRTTAAATNSPATPAINTAAIVGFFHNLQANTTAVATNARQAIGEFVAARTAAANTVTNTTTTTSAPAPNVDQVHAVLNDEEVTWKTLDNDERFKYAGKPHALALQRCAAALEKRHPERLPSSDEYNELAKKLYKLTLAQASGVADGLELEHVDGLQEYQIKACLQYGFSREQVLPLNPEQVRALANHHANGLTTEDLVAVSSWFDNAAHNEALNFIIIKYHVTPRSALAYLSQAGTLTKQQALGVAAGYLPVPSLPITSTGRSNGVVVEEPIIVKDLTDVQMQLVRDCGHWGLHADELKLSNTKSKIHTEVYRKLLKERGQRIQFSDVQSLTEEQAQGIIDGLSLTQVAGKSRPIIAAMLLLLPCAAINGLANADFSNADWITSAKQIKRLLTFLPRFHDVNEALQALHGLNEAQLLAFEELGTKGLTCSELRDATWLNNVGQVAALQYYIAQYHNNPALKGGVMRNALDEVRPLQLTDIQWSLFLAARTADIDVKWIIAATWLQTEVQRDTVILLRKHNRENPYSLDKVTQALTQFLKTDAEIRVLKQMLLLGCDPKASMEAIERYRDDKDQTKSAEVMHTLLTNLEIGGKSYADKVLSAVRAVSWTPKVISGATAIPLLSDDRETAVHGLRR